jgi:hypothetical protein
MEEPASPKETNDVLSLSLMDRYASNFRLGCVDRQDNAMLKIRHDRIALAKKHKASHHPKLITLQDERNRDGHEKNIQKNAQRTPAGEGSKKGQKKLKESIQQRD